MEIIQKKYGSPHIWRFIERNITGNSLCTLHVTEVALYLSLAILPRLRMAGKSGEKSQSCMERDQLWYNEKLFTCPLSYYTKTSYRICAFACREIWTALSFFFIRLKSSTFPMIFKGKSKLLKDGNNTNNAIRPFHLIRPVL